LEVILASIIILPYFLDSRIIYTVEA